MHRIALLVTALAAPVALADVTLTFEGTSGGRPASVTLQIQGKNLLITTTRAEDGRGTVVLRDPKGKRFLFIDHASKSYSVLSDEAAAGLKDQAAQVREMMAARLASLPPEQRAQAQAMLEKMVPKAAPAGPGAAAVSFSFEKRGTSRTVDGRACAEFLVKENGVAAGEGCFVAWKDAGITREALRQQFLEATEGLPTGTQSIDASLAAATAPGLLAWRRRVDAQGNALGEMTLKGLSTASLPASAFAVPADYTVRASGVLGRQ